MNIPKELQELRANIDLLTKKYKEATAMPIKETEKDHDVELKHKKSMEEETREMMMEMIGYVHQRIGMLENEFYAYLYDHMKNHPPHLKTASQMMNYLKMCGMSDDYEVIKPKITVASQKYGFDIK